MSAYQTEEEQIESLKHWWKANGRSTLLAIAAAFAIYFGWQAWQNHQKQQAEDLSGLFETLQTTVNAEPGQPLAEDQIAGARQLIDKIKETDSSSKYAVLSEFYAAKVAVDAGQLEQAITSLQWVVDQASEVEDIVLAKLRLARVYLAQENYDQTLSTIDSSLLASEFASLFSELQGDAYVGKADLTNARVAYQEAMSSETVGQRGLIIQMKLSDLGVADKEVNTSSDASGS